MEQFYSVRKKSGHYITWCDKCWYEIADYPYPHFTKEQAEAIVKQLRKHYCFDAYIEDKNGNPIVEPKENPICVEAKKSFFKKF